MGDKKIILDILNRNEKTFEYVINKYSKLLWNVVASVLINASSVCDIEECVADVFIYLWEHPEKYDPEKGKFSSWLSMVARSRAIDRFRKIMKENSILLDEEVLRDEYKIMPENKDERIDKLNECVSRLGNEEKEIIIRRYFYEQKNKEISLAMDLSPKQVENRIYNAKSKLRKMMED